VVDPLAEDNSQPQPLPWLVLWCVEFAMFFPSGSAWYPERFRAFRVTEYSGLLFDKPPGSWALRENAAGIRNGHQSSAGTSGRG
jgi:hypothetical protein